jgi:hypothetical protein
MFNPELSLAAHTSIFPSWEIERVNLSGYTATKGALTLRFGHYPAGPRAVVQGGGGKRPLYKGAVTSTVEAALLDVKLYLDESFPGMA